MKTGAATAAVLLLLSPPSSAGAFSANGGTVRNAAAAEVSHVLREWLLVGDRYSSSSAAASVEVAPPAAEGGGSPCCSVVTTRAVSAGDVLFRLGSPAVWSAAAAYRDRDLGPRLRDYAAQAGPGFASVALAGALGGERVRRYRSREGLGVAPESAGFTVPSEWGAFARWLWYARDEAGDDFVIDESLSGAVSEGARLLVPLLDMAARRYWSSDAADEPEATVPSEEWTRKALVEDGAPRSWSRGELEDVAMSSIGMVLQRTRSPPPFLLGGVGSLIPEPFVDRNSDPPETWPSGEGLAFVPLVDDIFPMKGRNDELNAVIGTPPRERHGGRDDCLWCVATRNLDVGERVVAPNPW